VSNVEQSSLGSWEVCVCVCIVIVRLDRIQAQKKPMLLDWLSVLAISN